RHIGHLDLQPIVKIAPLLILLPSVPLDFREHSLQVLPELPLIKWLIPSGFTPELILNVDMRAWIGRIGFADAALIQELLNWVTLFLVFGDRGSIHTRHSEVALLLQPTEALESPVENP